MKKIVTALLFILFVTSIAYADYWGSRKSDKYHYTDCRWAKKIKAQNLIVFISADDARRAGYVPCKVCNPPWSGASNHGLTAPARQNDTGEVYSIEYHDSGEVASLGG